MTCVEWWWIVCTEVGFVVAYPLVTVWGAIIRRDIRRGLAEWKGGAHGE